MQRISNNVLRNAHFLFSEGPVSVEQNVWGLSLAECPCYIWPRMQLLNRGEHHTVSMVWSQTLSRSKVYKYTQTSNYYH